MYWPRILGGRFGVLRQELRYFADCILKGTPPDRVPPAESRAVVQLMAAAAESSRTGQVVQLESSS
jgi:predicted dehydrogenase